MNPITRECQDCPDLEEVLSDIDCTILDLSKGFHDSIIYGIKECCNETLFQSLVNYRRIIEARTRNSHYPCYEYSSNEILGKARLLAYKTNCSRCPECEEVEELSCYSYELSNTTEFGTSYVYVNCAGEIDVTDLLTPESTALVCSQNVLFNTESVSVQLLGGCTS